MPLPILKSQWERYKSHTHIEIEHAQKLIDPYISHKIQSLTLLSDGCANTNYKITFQNDTPPLVLRIYIREKSALSREKALHQLLKNSLPVPLFFYNDASCTLMNHPYALMEWKEGELMRNVILKGDEKDIGECAFSAGKFLNVLRNIKLNQNGFFDGNLKIRPFNEEEEFIPFGLGLLKQKTVKESLSPSVLVDLERIFYASGPILPNPTKANLTHADFDPANMLVSKIDGKWQVSAILDWEFAFAGSYLMDMGLMLRYAHKLPKTYGDSFLNGLKESGEDLPKTWKEAAKLMDLLCLLQLLYYNPFSERPLMNRDVVELIVNTQIFLKNTLAR
ncbi:MAG: aminoglycoside phosphotransferase family protein [Alphaproteobacteria bacterium]|nr:aminoglycoside phosphotransferase family protein [Alphaproteobacteria bacterium]